MNDKISICKNESYVTDMNLSHFSTKYRALVIDSGAIIKLSGFRTLHNSACTFYTIPDVLKEIRDSKARHHLVNLPFKLQIRKESCAGVAHIISFSKMTGDYASLSVVDLKVLGLLYDLERG
jgi:RNA-binding protein NOB1